MGELCESVNSMAEFVMHASGFQAYSRGEVLSWRCCAIT